MLLGLYIRHELSYDSFHEKADRISLFRQWGDNAGSGSGFAALLKSEIAQVESVTRIMPVKSLVGVGNNAYYENNFCFSDSTIFNIFTIRVKEGDPEMALKTHYGVMLSQRMVNKYFPNEDPLGKTLRFNNAHDLVVTGVFENLPSTSHLTLDFLCNSRHAAELLNENLESFWDNRSLTYVLFSSYNVNENIRERLPAIVQKTKDQNAGIWDLSFLPLRDIYLYASLDGRVKARKAIQEVYIFSAIAFFILVLAAFNYINLSTAGSGPRSREVGVRKVLGANRTTLVTQFLGESTLYIGVAVLLSFVMVLCLLPYFNTLAETGLSITSFDTSIIGVFTGGLLILTLLTGAYPSLVLSAFKPVTVLKSDSMKTGGNVMFRKFLVVGQFTISVIMIVSTAVVMQQINFIRHKDLGYQGDQVVTITFPDAISTAERFTLKNELSQQAFIESITLCNSLPGNGAGRDKLVTEFVPQGAEDRGMDHVRADADFMKTFGVTLKEGRDFSNAIAQNHVTFVINESAVNYFGWDHAIGQPLGYYKYEYSNGGYREVPVRGEVAGVVEDYHQADLKSKIQPMMISYNTSSVSNMAIKIEGGKIPNALAVLESQWKKLFPDTPFVYQFLDEAFDQTYKKEVRTARIFGIFATLAIIISCLGLFGLSSFTARQRTKEIGIRKVFGASAAQISTMLSLNYIKLVIVANALALPAAWMTMDRWLQVFSYHIELSVMVFLLAGLLSIVIAALTVSGQALRASRMDPVRSLRNE